MSNIDKIRQEIERRKKICEDIFERESDTYYQGKAVAYGELFLFIDSLPDEHLRDSTKKVEQKSAEWSEDFEENIRTLLHNKLTWHSEDGNMSSTVFIDDKTLKDIVSGIWFYVGKEALKYPNKEIHVQEWSEEFLRLMGITISQDGNQVCVLLGENLAEGIAGFGDTLADAVEEFKKQWRQFDRFRKATWKPSEEQIEVFFKANPVNLMPDELAVYHSLCSDLKKL